MTPRARQRTTILCLNLLWLTPPAAVIWLTTEHQRYVQEFIDGWSGETRLPYQAVAFLIATAYAYLYAGVTLWRAAAWIDAGHRILTAPSAVRPLGLYLRPFAEDQGSVILDSRALQPFSSPQPELMQNPFGWLVESISRTNRRLDGTHLDQFLGPMFRRYIGDLVALGDPCDWLPRRGAARIYLSDSSSVEWQMTIVELVERSHVIILLAGESSGLGWELRYLRQHVPARRVIMVTPPARPVTWIEQVRALADADWSIHPCDPGPGCVIAFDENYSGLLLRSGARKAHDYVEVIEAYLCGKIKVDALPWPERPVAPLPSIFGLE